MAQTNSFVDDLVVQADQTLDHVLVNSSISPSHPSTLRDSIHKLSTAQTKSKPSRNNRQLIHDHLESAPTASTNHDQLLEWVLIGKATSQTYGLVLDTFLRQILPLNDEIDYWSSVLNSVHYTAFYSLQTAPARLYSWSITVYHDVRTNENLAQDSWNDFYAIVRSATRSRSFADAKAALALPTPVIRDEIRAKIAHLQRTKSAYAASIGLLLTHGFDTSTALHTSSLQSDAWRQKIADAVHIMDAVFSIPSGSEKWHDALDSATSSLSLSSKHPPTPAPLRQSLLTLLSTTLPAHSAHASAILTTSGRPSLLTRYWLPALTLTLSSSTLLRLVLSRRAALSTWAAEAGTTLRAFFANWVLAPATNLLRTIRHDDAADVALMSRASLEGDRASLERMVVSFAADNPPNGPLSTAELDAVRAAVHEGDLTPVLRSYENELKAPLRAAVGGNLIRALLIQIQKTKVDAALAIRGIDSLLQSQQLVFGLVSLTPGLLATVAAARYTATLFARRSSRELRHVRAAAPDVLLELDRVLCAASTETLSAENYGLLVVEAVVLRELAGRAMPRPRFAGFLRDFAALVDARRGVDMQRRALERIRWGFGGYFGLRSV